ncbi:hypothetical protein EDB85DRAFT_2147597 [Lactarius pseudohatsudake]|nr:hypothetical protein EDB85DRAFT_2147597 [Lactarius pseudohatsudake]
MAVAIMLYFAVGPPENEPILSAVQLFWIHSQVIVGTLAALALATNPGSSVLLDQKPDTKTDPSAIILIFHIFGSQILGFHHTDDSSLKKHHTNIMRTLVFNMFVFAQVSNSFNCRRLDQKLNVFEGMWRNWYIMAIITIGVVVQVLICSVGGPAFGVTHMGTGEWVISLTLASVSLPLGALIRLIPNERCEHALRFLIITPCFLCK